MIRNRKNNQLKKSHMTRQRRLLLELLQDIHGHVDAKELYLKASARDSSISQATVYRTLNLFKDLGLIEERVLGRVRCYYEISGLPEHQHLICRGCGKVMEIENPHFEELLQDIKREQRFTITKAELYLEGYCPDCEETKASGSTGETEG